MLLLGRTSTASAKVDYDGLQHHSPVVVVVVQGLTNASERHEAFASEFRLGQNYPNPFNVAGQLVATLFDGMATREVREPQGKQRRIHLGLRRELSRTIIGIKQISV